jgi:flagellar basal body rod protein FlgG
VFLNPAMSAALDRIADRAADVRRAFTPGALPEHDDVLTPAAASDFTLDPLAVSAPEDTYFITTGDRGRIAYTRDGSFSLHDGVLVDAARRAVCGMRAADERPSQLRVDPVDASLGRVRDPHVERDGSFVYRRETIDPRTGARELQRVAVGRVALARFPSGTRLHGGDGNELQAPGGIEPEIGLPGGGSFAAVVPMQRDRSRIDIDESLARLKDAYLAFDALAAAQAAKSRVGKTTLDLVK